MDSPYARGAPPGAPLVGERGGWRPARFVLARLFLVVVGPARAGAARAAVAARVALVVLARSTVALVVLRRPAAAAGGVALVVLVALVRTGRGPARVALVVLVALVGRARRRVARVAFVLVAPVARVGRGRVALVVLVALVRRFGGRGVIALIAFVGGVLDVAALLVLIALIVCGGVVALVFAARQVEADDAGGVRGQVLQRAREGAGGAHDPEQREQRDDRRRDLDEDPCLAVFHRVPPSLRRLRRRRDGVAGRPRDRVALVGEELGFVRDRCEVRGGGRRVRRERRAEVVDEPGEVEVLVAAVAGEQRLELLIRDLWIDSHLVWRNVEEAHRVTDPAEICLRIAASPLACSIFTAPSFLPTTGAISPIVRPPRMRRSKTSRWSMLRCARTSSTCTVVRRRIASSSASPRGAALRSWSSGTTSTGRRMRFRRSSTTRLRLIVKTQVRNAASSPSKPSM